jgi:hypothetical protein
MRQGERALGPIGPDTLAKNIVQWDLRPLEAVFNGAIRALGTAGVFGKQVTGVADGPDVETTERDTGCGQATRQRRLEDTRGQVHASEVTVYGWQVLLLIDAATTIPLAVKVGPIQERETHGTRALVTQARAHVAGAARLAQVVFEKGVWDGSSEHGGDRRRPGPSRGRAGEQRRPSSAHRPPWAGQRRTDRTAGDRGRRGHGTDHR